MGLEVATTIGGLIATNPVGTDGKNRGDDHIRLLKEVLKAQFTAGADGLTGPVTVTHLEMNQLAGITSSVIDSDKLAALPAGIGTTTPVSGAFTTLGATGLSTLAGQVDATAALGVTLADSVNTLNIGDKAAAHIAFDSNQMQGKSLPTATATLLINSLGGNVDIGAQSGTGVVNLYADTVLRAAVTNAGADFFGALVDLNSSADVVTRYLVRNSIGGLDLRVQATTGQAAFIQRSAADAAEDTWMTFDRNGAVSRYFNGTLRGQTTSSGEKTLGTRFDVDNSSAATLADLLVRNSEGGVKLAADGDNATLLQTDSAGVTEDIR